MSSNSAVIYESKWLKRLQRKRYNDLQEKIKSLERLQDKECSDFRADIGGWIYRLPKQYDQLTGLNWP